MHPRRAFLAATIATTLAIAVGSGLAALSPAAAEAPAVYTGLVKGVAVGGYDPVAYFTDNKPVKGNPAISLDHAGAKWYFATEANRDAFQKEPAKYAPQYG
ncbi:MAG: YHS domain-containing protein, partial [Proteobacteria bacterium]|nr:YHS domain-containing protein [Pseudomonadota bacterium]